MEPELEPALDGLASIAVGVSTGRGGGRNTVKPASFSGAAKSAFANKVDLNLISRFPKLKVQTCRWHPSRNIEVFELFEAQRFGIYLFLH